jgi:hypothetical protein
MGNPLRVLVALAASIMAAGPVLGADNAEANKPPPPPSRLSIQWVAGDLDLRDARVEVLGLPSDVLAKLAVVRWGLPQWQRLLSVHASQGDLLDDVGMPAMAGRYRVDGEVLRFEPLFPLEPQVTYRTVFRAEALPVETPRSDEVVSATLRLPAPSSEPATTVEAIYPSSPILPENLLKFYVHFSAPMSMGRIYDHIHLRDAAGQEVELPFLEIDEELWDPTMTRLTLFIDPGRIKRGVQPLEEVGPALQAGHEYRLAIDAAWTDAAGNRLKSPFQHAFRVGPPDREPPNPEKWRIHPPAAGSHDPLVVKFKEPMDHALALRLIRVFARDGDEVRGEPMLQNNERQWHFTPATAWKAGAYDLAVQTTIEDLAGNNIGKTFEVDVFESVAPRWTSGVARRGFKIR